MKFGKAVTLVALIALAATGCTRWPSDVNLEAAARDAGVTNITTGDGTFENYQAVNHHRHKEFGIAVGIPFLCKLFELYPSQSNQAQIADMAREAKQNGANAMINVSPPREFYTGVPFFIVGLYIDTTEGTGIRTK